MPVVPMINCLEDNHSQGALLSRKKKKTKTFYFFLDKLQNGSYFFLMCASKLGIRVFGNSRVFGKNIVFKSACGGW